MVALFTFSHALTCKHTNPYAQVEIDTDVPAAEFDGIAEQMQRLDDLEGLQDDWKVQAEARDEVRTPCLDLCLQT